MSTAIKFYKINLAFKLSKQCAMVKQGLLDELIINATDSVIVKRRLRMLYQLAEYESQILKKIYDYEADDFEALVNAWPIIQMEINSVSNRSA